MDLNGKRVLITGAAKRIGAGLVERFAEEGSSVVVHVNKSTDEGEQLVSALQEDGVEAYLVQADLAVSEDRINLFDQIEEECGSVDILINNASVFEVDTIREYQPEKARQQLEVNLLAPIHLAHLFVHQLKNNGCIVNILDQRITGLDVAHLSYVLSKKGLLELTKLLAVDLAPKVRVNAVAPGAILPPSGSGTSSMPEYAGKTLLKHACSIEGVADAVIQCAKQDSWTGQVLYVDSGQHLLA